MPYRLADTLQAKQPACLSAFPAPLMTNSSLTSHRVSFHHKKAGIASLTRKEWDSGGLQCLSVCLSVWTEDGVLTTRQEWH